MHEPPNPSPNKQIHKRACKANHSARVTSRLSQLGTLFNKLREATVDNEPSELARAEGLDLCGRPERRRGKRELAPVEPDVQASLDHREIDCEEREVDVALIEARALVALALNDETQVRFCS